MRGMVPRPQNRCLTAPQATASAAKPRSQTMRVLVIEDNPKMSIAIQKGLREQGFAADVTGTGFEGEDLACSNVYDLIVLDLMLPDRDGIEVCRNMRRRGVKSKILMLTALSS